MVRMRRLAPGLALAIVVVMLATSMSSAAPYRSFDEFADDMLGSATLASSAAAARYSYAKTVHKEPTPVAVVKGAWAGATMWMAHQTFVVAPRLQDTVISILTP